MIYQKLFVTTVLFFITLNAHAADSYRFLHVTIDTPWAIFVFLLFIVMFPFVLMAILYWYFAFQKDNETAADSQKSNQDGTM